MARTAGGRRVAVAGRLDVDAAKGGTSPSLADAYSTSLREALLHITSFASADPWTARARTPHEPNHRQQQRSTTMDERDYYQREDRPYRDMPESHKTKGRGPPAGKSVKRPSAGACKLTESCRVPPCLRGRSTTIK